jgi:hypothetical protein
MDDEPQRRPRRVHHMRLQWSINNAALDESPCVNEREREWSVWMTESTRFLCQLERGPGEHGHGRWSVIRSFSFLFPSDIWTTGSNGTGCPASACAQRLAGPDTLPGYARIISYDTRTPPYHRRSKSCIRTARARAVDGQAGCFLPPSSSQKSNSWQVVNTRARSIVAYGM